MDFGSMHIDQSLKLYLFGTPARTASASCGATSPRRPRRPGDRRRPRLDDCYPAVDYFERFELPFS